MSANTKTAITAMGQES